MKFTGITLLASVGLASSQAHTRGSSCPSNCSRHGICGANAKCYCYATWQGSDCSLRTCPYHLAWADTADGTNSAHYYAECSNKGMCDRKTGDCKCFDGYEGKSCRRASCPDKCSGHGTCELMEEMGRDFGDRRYGPGAMYRTRAGTKIGEQTTATQAVPTHTTRAQDVEMYHGFLYNEWDADKSQGCTCDLGWDGPDCGHRLAPKGDDPLTTVKSQPMVQLVQLGASAGTPDYTTGAQQTFVMVYHDPYGGVWRTQGISASATDATTAEHVQYALRGLPSNVLEGVSVAASTGTKATCHRQFDGVQHIAAHRQDNHGVHRDANGRTNKCLVAGSLVASASAMDFAVTFANAPGQTGIQYLFEVETRKMGAGCFPVSEGMSTTNSAAFTVAEFQQPIGSLSELSDCSDRGLDDGEGNCDCFDGYAGLACENQEALV
jgi:hypothetical protein